MSTSFCLSQVIKTCFGVKASQAGGHLGLTQMQGPSMNTKASQAGMHLDLIQIQHSSMSTEGDSRQQQI